ncbi:general secretion pathway protein GspK [Bradyrhizobium sp.]|uniref:general secretion pathway protein GspK n=1 Tax=Bradyrhizobium sp. TaxID=376 RepID=UPI0025BB1CAB|nr:type II secretion system protein GspK [Bradyrhizobium sp.]
MPERGFIIVAVLWLVAALASLAMIFALYLSNSARTLGLNDTALQVEALASAGVELAAYQLQLSGDEARPARGSFHTRLNGADISVGYLSEAARIDLNAAPKELLAGLMSVLGARGDDASEFADRIIAWRTKPTPESAGNEDALYRAAGRAYSPRQGPFAHVNELALVLGPPPALVERALPFVTVFSGESGVDVINAPAEVIAALPGMTPLVLRQFLNGRASLGNDAAALATALGPAGASAMAQKSKAYRLSIQIRVPDGRQNTSEVVIGLDGKDEPYRVLSWQDHLPQRRAAGER